MKFFSLDLTRQERTELKELKNNQTIRVLPTDKDLGPALLSTDGVKNETLRHLYDDLSYSRSGMFIVTM